MKKTWTYSPPPHAQKIASLSRELNINNYLSELLLKRGIDSFEHAKKFFNPSLCELHDPFEMRGMKQAVTRLSQALSNKEKILLYGDYDVDGTTAVSLLYLFLTSFSDRLEYYIPDRYSEGYGLSEKGITYASENHFTLIIALDCGIRAHKQAQRARELNIDLIICDHHVPASLLPDAFAILDPKQKGCPYPFKELSGCGVGFKFLQGFCKHRKLDSSRLFEYLDLVAVSIAGDIVPMIGENRVLTFHGLIKLNQNPSAGLKTLKESCQRKKEMSVSDVVFRLCPRINAAGRLAHAKESVNLLISGEEEATPLVQNLNLRNETRRTYDQHSTQEALRMIQTRGTQRKSTVLFKESWHKGIVGIVASRCIEHHYKPTIILTESNGKATGSARSVEGFDLLEAIEKCADLLDQYGGHKYAAGLTLPLENVERFTEKFEEVVSKSISNEQLIPKIEIDACVPFSFINFKTFRVMNRMAPFGPHNMTPLFSTKNVVLVSPPSIIKNTHLKGTVREENGTQELAFIGFGLAEEKEKMRLGVPFHIAYSIVENTYLGKRSLVLQLRDIQF